MRTISSRITLFVTTLLGAAALSNAATYSFSTVSVPGLTNTVATGINASLAIVGYGTNGSNVTTGFLLSAGQVTTIFVPGSKSTTPNGLNDSGQIVGTYTNATGSHGFEYSNATYTTIDAPSVDAADGLTFEAGTTNLVGISNSGKIAGYATGVYGPFAEACAFTDNAGTFTFYFEGGGTVSIPGGISAAGEFAFSWTGIELPEFLTVDYHSTNSSARFQIPFDGTSGINDEDQMVIDGSPSTVSPGASPFQPTGPAIAYPGATSTNFIGINNAGWLVGSYVDSSQATHAFVAFPEPTLPNTPDALIVKSSGLCLDVQGGSKQPGAATVQDPCKGIASQQWQATPASDGSIELLVQSDGYSLDVTGKSVYPGAAVIQWPYGNGANEHWYFQTTPDGYYNIVSQNSRLCLDIVGGTGAASGAATEQNVCSASASQKWSFAASAAPIPTTFSHLVVKSSGECLNVQGQSYAAGAPVIQWACGSGTNELWKPVLASSGYYELVVQYTGYSLDVQAKSTAPGASVVQWPYQNTSNEHWDFQPTPDGYYNVVSQNSGLCLDIVGGVSAPAGALTEQNTCNASDSQKWSFVAP